MTVLPGSYLARETAGPAGADGRPTTLNPGRQRIRMALVAETAECVEAAKRIVQFVQART